MQENSTSNHSTAAPEALVQVKRKSNGPNVLVCLGEETPALGPIRLAQLTADSLGGNVILVSVVEPQKSKKMPFDPVEWDIQRREAKAVLANLAKKLNGAHSEIETRLLEGHPVDQICACVSKRPQDITAVFRQAGETGWNVNDPARCLVEANVGSVLIIPTQPHAKHSKSISKIIVTLDGSPRAESAIPKAVRLAKANKAELILCHIAPEPQLTQIGRVDPAAQKLRKQAVLENKRLGQQYLNRIEAKMTDCDVRASTLVAGGTDVRRALMNVIGEQKADFVVLASHGQSNNSDVPMGDIASFVIGRSPVPILMVRPAGKRTESHVFSDVKSEGVRHPSDSMQ